MLVRFVQRLFFLFFFFSSVALCCEFFFLSPKMEEREKKLFSQLFGFFSQQKKKKAPPPGENCPCAFSPSLFYKVSPPRKGHFVARPTNQVERMRGQRRRKEESGALSIGGERAGRAEREKANYRRRREQEKKKNTTGAANGGLQLSSGLAQTQWGDNIGLARDLGTQKRGRGEEAPSWKRPSCPAEEAILRPVRSVQEFCETIPFQPFFRASLVPAPLTFFPLFGTQTTTQETHHPSRTTRTTMAR